VSLPWLDIMAEDESSNKVDNGGEVLIERAGKFELLNASDMRADSDGSTEQKDEETGSDKGDAPEQGEEKVPEQKSAETVVEDLETDGKLDQELAIPEVIPQYQSKSEVVVTHRTPPKEDDPKLLPRGTQNSGRLRTKSAPGPRVNEASQEAYDAWLAKKNEEITARRKAERAKVNILTAEDVRRKKEEAEASFQAWLTKKNKQIQEERLLLRQKETVSRPTTGNNKQECSEAFKAWLEAKRKQESEERRTEAERLKHQQEAANQVDPNLAQQAFRE